MSGNPYPANILRADGEVDLEGSVFFTDPDNQPGGGSQSVSVATLTLDAAQLATFGGATPRYQILPPAQAGHFYDVLRANCSLVNGGSGTDYGYIALTDAAGGGYLASQQFECFGQSTSFATFWKVTGTGVFDGSNTAQPNPGDGLYADALAAGSFGGADFVSDGGTKLILVVYYYETPIA